MRDVPEDNSIPTEATEHDPLPPPPRWLRILLTVLGIVLLALGLVGLALPVVPQLIPLVLGATALAVVSEGMNDRVQRWLRRWPRARKGVQNARWALHRRLVRWFPRHYEKHPWTEPDVDPGDDPRR